MLSIEIKCKICGAKAFVSCDLPSGWSSNLDPNAIFLTEMYCPKHAPLQVWDDRQCDSCKYTFGKCGLLEYYKAHPNNCTRELKKCDFTYKGICPIYDKRYSLELYVSGFDPVVLDSLIEMLKEQSSA